MPCEMKDRNQEIKRLYLTHSSLELAKKFNVSAERIRVIADPDGHIVAEKKKNLITQLDEDSLQQIFILNPKVKSVFDDLQNGVSESDILNKYQFRSKYALTTYLSLWRGRGVPFELNSMATPRGSARIIKDGLDFIKHQQARIALKEKIRIRNQAIFEAYFRGDDLNIISKTHKVHPKVCAVVSNNIKHKMGLDITRINPNFKAKPKAINQRKRKVLSKTERRKRNERIYKRYYEGDDKVLIAKDYQLKASSISVIAHTLKKSQNINIRRRGSSSSYV